MKTIIAGSRQGITYEEVKSAIENCPWFSEITIIVSGTAQGVDSHGEFYAFEKSIPVIRYPADWNQYGKGAGFIRNEQMAKEADALISIWDGVSPGSAHMIQMAKKHGLRLWVNTKKETEPIQSRYVFPSRENNAKAKSYLPKQSRDTGKHKRTGNM